MENNFGYFNALDVFLCHLHRDNLLMYLSILCPHDPVQILSSRKTIQLSVAKTEGQGHSKTAGQGQSLRLASDLVFNPS